MNRYEAIVEESYTVRSETFNGIEYFVVPVTMMVEGVHIGSRGPLLHTAAELGKIPESWNGIPVTIGHPKVDENFVPANSPIILQTWAVGVVFNAHMDGTKLRAEAWLDKNKLQANFENVHDRINNGEEIEVSVGVFSDEEEVEGTWHNETYTAIATNLRPEHLAILPNQEGACSLLDGCGIRVNNKFMVVNEKNLKTIQELKHEGYMINFFVAQEKSLMEKVEKVRTKIYSMDGEQSYFYVEDVHDDAVIYRKEDRVKQETKLYKQGYAMAADGSVEFVGEPIVVKKKVEYETVVANNEAPIVRTRKKINNNSKKEVKMSEKEVTPCVQKRVNALIANTATKFTENDKAWLETLEEGQLDAMIPNEVKPEVKQAEITSEMAINALKGGLKETEDFIGLMPGGMQEQMRSALSLHQQKKGILVQSVLDNTDDGVWVKDELEAMGFDQLEKLAKTAGYKEAVPGNYAGMGAGGGTRIQNNEQDDIPIMAPMGINFETKK